MTRETKIGLLVGLAFIIVIGILLSDHLTSSTEPPPATLANAGNNVRQTVTTPGSNNTQPPITIVQAPQQVAPDQPVLTPNELQPRPQPVQIVQVGALTGSAQQVQQQQPQQRGDQTQASQASQPDPNDAPIITQAPPVDSISGALSQAAQQHGEGLVTLDSSGRPSSVAPNGLKEYKAEAGDTVSKMAIRFLGANTKVNREAIIKSNPSLQQDPNKVIVGKAYLIPSAGVADTGQPAAPVAQATAPQPSATEYWYTVKENDSLWKIANEQLGNPGAVAAIKELNHIADENKVAVGMKLKLPGKPVAKAN